MVYNAVVLSVKNHRSMLKRTLLWLLRRTTVTLALPTLVELCIRHALCQTLTLILHPLPYTHNNIISLHYFYSGIDANSQKRIRLDNADLLRRTTKQDPNGM